MTDDASSAERAAVRLELANGLEHAAKVCWQWARDGDGPWDRIRCLGKVERLNAAVRELREPDPQEHLARRGR